MLQDITHLMTNCHLRNITVGRALAPTARTRRGSLPQPQRAGTKRGPGKPMARPSV